MGHSAKSSNIAFCNMKLTLVFFACLFGMSMSGMSPVLNCYNQGFEKVKSKSPTPHNTVYGNSDQKHGYALVRPGAHMFWWLSRSKAVRKTPTEIPLAIWLQGGPGEASSGYGNFGGIGPLDMDLNDRQHSWINHMHVLFVDSPVGAGFSYVDHKGLLAETDHDMAVDLVALVESFLNESSEFKSVPLHIFGESYGGKIAMEFAYLLQKKKLCQLKSVTSIGGWISPKHSIASWAPFLLQAGLIDPQGEKAIAEAAKETKHAMTLNDFAEVLNKWQKIITDVQEQANGINWCDITRKVYLPGVNAERIAQNAELNLYVNNDYTKLQTFMSHRVHQALSLGKVQWGHWSNAAYDAAKKDFMVSAHRFVEKLLTDTTIQVNVVSGQFDLTAATSGTVDWVDALEWPKKVNGETKKIIANGNNEGYYRTQHQLTLYSVRRSGRAVPLQNPEAMDWILQHIIDKPLAP